MAPSRHLDGRSLGAEAAAMTLHGRLAAVAALDGERSALLTADGTITFAGLWQRVERVAAAVTGGGDPVALVAWNGPWWVEAAFGVPMASRALAMISPRLTVGEIAAQLDTVGASLVVVDPSVVPDVTALRRPGRDVVDLADWTTETSVPTSPAAHVDGDDAAWLVFTSGTTATPRAAELTHGSLLAAVAATAAARPEQPDDVYLFVFPMWHVALYNVVCRLMVGRPVVLHERFDPAAIVADVQRHGVTSISLAATMLDALLDHVDDTGTDAARLATLRDVTYGAAPMPAAALRRAADRLDVRFWQGYGMTELSGNAVFLGADDHAAGLAGRPELLRAAGRPSPGVDVRIAGDDDVPVPAGSAGEIQVRAAQVMAGYWHDPGATAAAFTDDGWLRTGDIGRLDDGVLSVLDRKKDVIITGGENVSAREIEEVLREHPDVADVAVVGVPDPRWGENVCAVVVLHGDASDATDLAALRAFARTRLAGFKVPRHVVVRDSLPVNTAGKVVKAELRAWLALEPERLGARG